MQELKTEHFAIVRRPSVRCFALKLSFSEERIPAATGTLKWKAETGLCRVMTFIAPSACASPNSQQSSSSKQSRRGFLQIAITSTLAAFFPTVSQAQESGLPPGAAQFSRLLAAQKQWSGVSEVLERGELTDRDWENLRGYLRSVYAVSGDMEFIAKPWNKPFKDQGLAIASQFRSTVKGMDKPAIRKDTTEFRQMHEEVEGIFKDFFSVFKNATVSDIPDEL